MQTRKAMQYNKWVSIQPGIIRIHLSCKLCSIAEANELIDMLVRAKNLAFPSGAEEHKRNMEALGV